MRSPNAFCALEPAATRVRKRRTVRARAVASATVVLRGAVVAAAILLPAIASAAFGEEPARSLPNFHEVSDGLFRGARPGEGGMKELARLGIRTIVDLRTGDEIEEERAEAIEAGLRHINVPFGAFRRPADEGVERVLGLLAESEHRPVFVHCRRGRDRTGMMIACYRMRYEGWTAERALKEATRHGLAWWQFRMKGYIKDECGEAAREVGLTAAPAAGAEE